MYRKSTKQRIPLAALLAATATVVTLDFRENPGGPIRRVQDFAVSVVAPLQDGIGRVLRPVGDFLSSLGEIGNLTPRPTDRVVDGSGLVLAPGFIDTHSHHDRGLFERREALAAVSQGITTIVVGQDGASVPLRAFFARLETEPVAVNVASYVGHGTLRDRVMGHDYRRAASDAEVGRMKALLREEMDAGAASMAFWIFCSLVLACALAVPAIVRLPPTAITAGTNQRMMTSLPQGLPVAGTHVGGRSSRCQGCRFSDNPPSRERLREGARHHAHDSSVVTGADPGRDVGLHGSSSGQVQPTASGTRRGDDCRHRTACSRSDRSGRGPRGCLLESVLHPAG